MEKTAKIRMETPRLRIVPFTCELVKAALEDRMRLKELLQAEIPQDWPNNDFREILPFMLQKLLQNPDEPVWNGLILRKNSPVLVEDAGLKEGPDQKGSADLGYSIVPEHQGKGYATETARAVVEWALRRKEIHRVTAECSAANIASIRVLEKTGFCRIRDDGIIIRWEFPYRKEVGET
ncbi:MAG: GNAT family N-acetyltransferase [Thermoactinomyces sp.]